MNSSRLEDAAKQCGQLTAAIAWLEANRAGLAARFSIAWRRPHAASAYDHADAFAADAAGDLVAAAAALNLSSLIDQALDDARHTLEIHKTTIRQELEEP